MKNREHIISIEGFLDSIEGAEVDAVRLLSLLKNAEQKRFAGKIILDFAQAERMTDLYANHFVALVFRKYSLSFVLQYVDLKNRNCFIINAMNEATQRFFQANGSNTSCENCQD